MAEGSGATALHSAGSHPEHRNHRQALTPTVRRATSADLDDFYGAEPCRPTITALIGVLDGKIIACGGFAHVRGILIAFCDLEPEARKYPLLLVRSARALVREMGTRGKVIYATANKAEPNVKHWLRCMGFEPVEGIEGRYKWAR